MKYSNFLLKATLLPCLSATVAVTQTHYFSIQLTLTESSSVRRTQELPVVDVVLTNISTSAIKVEQGGAFFDYSVKLTDANGNPVPLSKEGRAIRSGGAGSGFVIQNARGSQLEPGQSVREDLQLQRYFDVKEPGTYKLLVMRKFQRPPDTVTSNTLSISIK